MKKLLEKYQKETLTEAQKKLLDQWFLSFDEKKEQVAWDLESKNRVKSNILAKIWNLRIVEESQSGTEMKGKFVISRITRNLIHSKYAIAASIALFLICGALFWFVSDLWIASKPEMAVMHKNDVLPGGNKAILTLSGGASILLEDVQKGLIAKEGKTEIIKEDKGILSYHAKEEPVRDTSSNLLSVPRGGQYHLVLPDGTKIWLNSESSIRFPTIFNNKRRVVKLKGEAYFEVAKVSVSSKNNGKETNLPFIIMVNDAEISVLGTHFNVNAYDNEERMKVSLLEGSVQVSSLVTKHSVLIVPGQQASLSKAGDIFVKKVDVENSVAWKKGYFHFDHADIKTVMRQLSRWYDVEVIYEGEASTEEEYGGEIQRNLNLSQVLNVLQKSGIRFYIDGKTIIVNSDK